MKIFTIIIVSFLLFTISCKENKQSNDRINGIIANDSVQTSNTENIANLSLRSTVMVIMEDRNHQVLALGSGVILEDKRIVTNYHVIENAHFGKVKKFGSDSTFPIKQILAIDKSNDLVILDVPTLNKDVKIEFDTIKPQIGRKVFAVGNPKGLEGTFSEGIISGIRNYDDSSMLIQISAPISPGSSGGQIIGENSSIIGIAVGGILEGQNLNFAIPSKYVIKLLSNHQSPLPLSENKSSKIKYNSQQLLTQAKNEILIKNLDWLKDGGYDPYGHSNLNPLLYYSIYNGLESTISEIRLLFILYDRENLPVDYSSTIVSEAIPPKLAKKITNFELNYAFNPVNHGEIDLDKKRGYRCEVRILDFKIDKQ